MKLCMPNPPDGPQSQSVRHAGSTVKLDTRSARRLWSQSVAPGAVEQHCCTSTMTGLAGWHRTLYYSHTQGIAAIAGRVRCTARATCCCGAASRELTGMAVIHCPAVNRLYNPLRIAEALCTHSPRSRTLEGPLAPVTSRCRRHDLQTGWPVGSTLLHQQMIRK